MRKGTKMRTRKPKGAVSVSKAVERKRLGNEPVLSHNPSPAELAEAYTWYRDYYDSDTSKKFAIEAMTEAGYDPVILQRLSKVKSAYFGNLGYSFRILTNNGDVLPDSALAYMKRRISELSSMVVVTEVEEPAEPVPVSTRADRSENRANGVIADFEDVIDYFLMGTMDEFDSMDYMRTEDIKAPVATKIIDFYRPLYHELGEAIAGKSADLKEAYARWDKGRLRLYLNLIKGIIEAAQTRIEVIRKARKPRARKVKSPDQLVTKVQYLTEDPEYKIRSVDPGQIIGAAQVWLFNVKYRTLTLLNSNEGGLSIKGTTIQNFNEKNSVAKRLRKPESILTSVTSEGKVALRKMMDTIKTAAIPATGRIGKDTVILRVMRN